MISKKSASFANKASSMANILKKKNGKNENTQSCTNNELYLMNEKKVKKR